MDENLNLGENVEIEKALKEFELKSNLEQAQKPTIDRKTSDVPKMAQLVMKYSGGAIKEQRQAEYILLGLAILMFGLSLFFFFK